MALNLESNGNFSVSVSCSWDGEQAGFTVSLLRGQTLWPSVINPVTVPVAAGRFGRLGLGDGPRSGLSVLRSLLGGRLPVRGTPALHPGLSRSWSRGWSRGRSLAGGDAGLRPAAGELPVVLVVHVQQLPWTEEREREDGRTHAPRLSHA